MGKGVLSREKGASGVESQTVSRYLEAIYYIDAEGERVKAARLAEWLGGSQPTAGPTPQRMVRAPLAAIPSANDLSPTPHRRHPTPPLLRPPQTPAPRLAPH